MDSILNLSSDLSLGAASSDPFQFSLKSTEVFDEYERLRLDSLAPCMLTSYLASHFLSPNGYLAYALNFDAFTTKEQ